MGFLVLAVTGQSALRLQHTEPGGHHNSGPHLCIILYL